MYQFCNSAALVPERGSGIEAEPFTGRGLMRNFLVAVGACALVSASAASAQKARQTGIPPQMQQLLACRAIADSVQRLACFDQQTAAVDKAINDRDLVLIDREKARATKRSLFGFSVPDFGGIFGGNDDEVKEIASTVAAVRRNHEGGWMIRLADGSTWSQTDDTTIAIAPERGQKVVVRRGSFGVFYLRLNGQPGVRVQRVG